MKPQLPQLETKEQRKHFWTEWLKDRDRARTDLFWLANYVLSPPDSRILVRHAHDCIVDHCQKFKGRQEVVDPETGKMLLSRPRVSMWELEGSRNNMLLVSRGHLKTTVHTVAHIIQWIINYEDVRILICTATDEKARMMVNEIRGHFQFNPIFRFFFPEYCPVANRASDFGSQTDFTVPCRRRRAKEPTVMTASVGKALASTHHDVIKCSDVVTENNVKTPGQIQEVIDFFGYIEPLRERGPAIDGQPNPGWKDVEGTIYDFSDFYQKILDHEASLHPDKRQWQITKRSCWADKQKRIPLWPERFPAAELDRIANSPEVGPVLFSAQYELEPIRAEDGLAKPEEIKFFPAHLIGELMPRYSIYCTVDLSNMDPSTPGDDTVFTVAGFDRDGRIDVLSIQSGRFTQDQVVEMFFTLDRLYPSMILFKVQRDHFALMLKPLMENEMAKRGRWLPIEYTPISNRVSKVRKIMGLQGWFKLGKIRFADSITCKNQLILQILRFPKGTHDDILDTISDLLHDAKGGAVSAVIPDAPKATGLPAPPWLGKKFMGFDEFGRDAWLDEAPMQNEYFHEVIGL